MLECTLFPEKIGYSVYWQQGMGVPASTPGSLTHSFDKQIDHPLLRRHCLGTRVTDLNRNHLFPL